MNLEFRVITEDEFWEVKERYEKNKWQSLNQDDIICFYDNDTKTYLVFDEYTERDGEVYIEDFKNMEDIKHYYNIVVKARRSKKQATA